MKKIAPLLLLCCFQCILAMEPQDDQPSVPKIPDYLKLRANDSPILSPAVTRAKSLDNLPANPDLDSVNNENVRKSLEDDKRKSLENLLARRLSSQNLLLKEKKSENNEQQQQQQQEIQE